MPARATKSTTAPTRKFPVDPTAGRRLKVARLRAGLTQRQLAGDRYTAAYISALEKGLTRASMAVRLGRSPRGRTFRPKAMFWATVMWRNRA